MPWVHDRLIIQAEEAFPNALHQRIVVATGQVGPADRTGEEHITNEQVPLTEQTNSSRRMPGDVNNLECQLAKLKRVTLSQQLIRLWRWSNLQTIDLRVVTGILQ